MLGKLVRILLALTAIAPLSVSLAYVFAKEHHFLWAAIAAACCVGLGAIALFIINKASSTFQDLPITILKVKSADKEVIGFFVAYALPLVFRGSSSPDLDGWLFTGGMLLFVLWSTHAIQVNPILGVIGFHFYEVEVKGGVSYLLITRRRIANAMSVERVVQLSEYGILEVQRKTKASAT
jgi:hypothetical protein